MIETASDPAQSKPGHTHTGIAIALLWGQAQARVKAARPGWARPRGRGQGSCILMPEFWSADTYTVYMQQMWRNVKECS